MNNESIYPELKNDEDGLYLDGNGMKIRGDFSTMLPRLNKKNLSEELLVKAASIKGESNLTVLDATAGMGEDSLLLAAAGFHVKMFEYNPVIAALLKDAMRRAEDISALGLAVSRMEFVEGDSIEAMNSMTAPVDVIFLDPMFPEREKSGLIKKKFQLLQKLESPCNNEHELFDAAMKANPKRIVVKRPEKGPNLAGAKPSYSLKGKAIRYDVYVVRG